MMFTKKNEEAVSPVIGVILMVAITVILAAVIAAFVFGMAGNVQKTKVVSVTLQRGAGNTVTAIFNGGTDAAATWNVNFSVAGVVPTNGYFNAIGSTSAVPLGCRTTFATSANPVQITAIGYFSDGSTQILMDRLI